MRRPAVFLPLLLSLVALLPTGAAAHPADEFFQLHQLKLTSAGVELELYLFPGPLVARLIWQDADTDGDDRVGPAEARAFAEGLQPRLHFRLEQQELAWTLTAAEFPAAFQPLQIGDEGIWLKFEAAWPAGSHGDHWFELTNDNYVTNGRFWFDLAAADGVTLGRQQSERNRLVAEFTLLQPAPGAAPAGESAQAGTVAADADEATRQAQERRSPWLRRLDGLLRAPALTLQFFAVALLVALVLGALHALTPGHGKTIVAAYLVGSRGTVGHAAFLGGVVTLTHTGSVLLLGLLAMVASRAILPSRLTPLLELASGALIIALGLHLLWSRLRTRQHPHDHHHHPHDHGHEYDQPHDHTHHASRITSHHHHHYFGYAQYKVPAPTDTSATLSTSVTWRSLLALGISGGLVPCPDAIAILLIAVAIQRILLGLLLILAFSAGLAAVLIAIGVALVTSKGLLARRFDRFEPVAQWLPVVSAVVVTALGVAVAARAVGAL